MDIEKEVAMMSDPMKWPLMVLPLKSKDFRTGFMVGNGPTVYEGNIYEMSGKSLDEVPKEVYTDYYGIVDAGWRVD
jgi:hypothetical protein